MGWDRVSPAAKIYHEIPQAEERSARPRRSVMEPIFSEAFSEGLLGGILFLPVLGLWETCVVVAMIKASSFILLLLSTKFIPKSSNHSSE